MIARLMGFIVALILTVHGYLWGDTIVFICGLLSFGIVLAEWWRARHPITYPVIYTRRGPVTHVGSNNDYENYN